MEKFVTAIKSHAGQRDLKAALAAYNTFIASHSPGASGSNEKIPQQTFTMLLNMAVAENQPDKASIFLHHMVDSTVTPSLQQFQSVINLFSKNYQSAQCEKSFALLEKANVEPDVKLFNAMIKSFAKAGDAAGAIKYFELIGTKRLKTDLMSYNNILHTAARAGKPKMAMTYFDEMKDRSVSPDVASANCVLDAFSRGRNWHGCEEFFMKTFVNSGGGGDAANDSSPQSTYANVKVRETKKMRPSEISFNSLINSFRHADDCSRGIEWFNRMSDFRVQPSNITYNSVLHLYAEHSDYESASIVFQRMQAFDESRKGRKLVDGTSWHTLMSAFVRAGKMNEAEIIFRNMQKFFVPDALTYRCLSLGFKRVGDKTKAELYGDMLRQVASDTRFNSGKIKGPQKDRATNDLSVEKVLAQIKACVPRRDLNTACRLFESLHGRTNVNVPLAAYETIIRLSNELDDGAAAEKVIKLMIKNELNPSLDDFTSTIKSFVKNNKPRKAAKFVELLKENGVQPHQIVLGSVLNGFAKGGDVAGAREFARKIQDWGCTFDVTMLNLLLHCCARAAEPHTAIEIIKEYADEDNHFINESGVACGVLPDTRSINFVMEAFIKSNDIPGCAKYFHDVFVEKIAIGQKHVVMPNVTSFNFLIAAYAHQNVDESIIWFERMAEFGVEPNAVSVNTILDVLSIQDSARATMWLSAVQQKTALDIYVRGFQQVGSRARNNKKPEGVQGIELSSDLSI